IAYELFPSKKHLFDVQRRNITVNRYNETYKTELLYLDEVTNYYTCPKENFEKYKRIHIRMFYKE
ncbi:MAG: hypothetical protein LBI60_02770, partial [Bacteroidales bacterium]|nr:hypothetical protein [Bacteroidales bacterium]